MNVQAYKVLFLVLLLAGCASDPVAEQNQATKFMEYKMQVYGPACERLGYKKDTDAWRDCIQKEYEHVIIRQERMWNYPYWNPYRPPFNYRR